MSRLALGLGLGMSRRAAAGDNVITFYVDPIIGLDTNDGRTPATAWQSLAKVIATDLPKPSKVLFKGGAEFVDEIDFDPSRHYGTEGAIVTFGSYGVGKAIFRAPGNGYLGIYAPNPRYITIRDLIFIGTGNAISTGYGMYLANDQAGNTKLPGVSILNNEVSGFGQDGIAVYSAHATASSGFDGLLIEGNLVHDCTGNCSSGQGQGITVQGKYGLAVNPASHTNLRIRKNIVYNCTGTAGRTNHSGSGILIGQCAGALVEWNETYNNGENNTFASGPVGCWMYDCDSSVIQFNESHHNKTGIDTADGGGFDIDGGCTNCVIQYNYSHDNHGSGYQLFQFEDEWINPLTGNTIRYNISENDGLQNPNRKGGILIGTAETRVAPNNNVYGNTVFKDIDDGNGVYFINGDKFTGVFGNNIFDVRGANSRLISDPGAIMPGQSFAGNLYYTGLNNFVIRWANTYYETLDEWRLASGEETQAGKSTGINADPLLVAIPLGNTGGFNPILLGAYKTQPGSPARGKAVDLLALFGIEVGSRDIFGNVIGHDIGCFESGDPVEPPVEGPVILYVASTGSDSNDGLSPATAKKTIAAIPKASGMNISLARGSVWREELDLGLFESVTINAYGTGPLPVLDASNVAPSNWVVDGTYPNVYNQSLAHSGDTELYLSIWENGIRPKFVADKALCDTTPGTFTVGLSTTGFNVFSIHPSGSTNPATDGKLYEYSARNYGLHLGANSVVSHLRTRKQIHNNGSTIMGSFSVANNCIFEDGVKHNLFASDGCVLNDCIAWKSDWIIRENHTSFVAFDPTIAAGEVQFNRCISVMELAVLEDALARGTDSTGFYAHTDGEPGHLWSNIIWNQCTTKNNGTGFSVADTALITSIRCHAETADNGFSFNAQQNNVIDPWANETDGVKMNRPITSFTAGTLDIDGARVFTITGGDGQMFDSGSGTLNLAKSVFVKKADANFQYLVRVTGDRVLNMGGCILSGSQDEADVAALAVMAPGIIDINYYAGSINLDFEIDGNSYFNYADYRAANPALDPNSIITGFGVSTGLVDPENGNFNLQPGSPAIAIGAGLTRPNATYTAIPSHAAIAAM